MSTSKRPAADADDNSASPAKRACLAVDTSTIAADPLSNTTTSPTNTDGADKDESDSNTELSDNESDGSESDDGELAELPLKDWSGSVKLLVDAIDTSHVNIDNNVSEDTFELAALLQADQEARDYTNVNDECFVDLLLLAINDPDIVSDKKVGADAVVVLETFRKDYADSPGAAIAAAIMHIVPPVYRVPLLVELLQNFMGWNWLMSSIDDGTLVVHKKGANWCPPYTEDSFSAISIDDEFDMRRLACAAWIASIGDLDDSVRSDYTTIGEEAYSLMMLEVPEGTRLAVFD